MTARYAVLSGDAWRLRGELEPILRGDVVRGAVRCDAVVDWADGRGAAARGLARLVGRPFHALTVGPLGGVRPERETPMSLAVDGFGPAVAPDDAEAGLALLRRLRLAWRNDGRDRAPPGWREGGALVVADRDAAATAARLERARRDGFAGRIAAVADGREPPRPGAGHADGLRPLVGVNPWALFDAGPAVYAGGAELGKLARLAGLAVDGERAADAALAFRAEFLDRPTYLDAWSRRPVPFAEAAKQLAWLRDRFGENDRRSFCVGVSGWKADAVGRFLDGPDGPAAFETASGAAAAGAARAGGRVVAWETRMPERLAADCAAAGVPLLRMEDGFLRSVGLGAAFLPGASAVLDGRGIYYDPSGPSDLEAILAEAAFPPDLLRRAAALRERVVALRLSKYNVGRGGTTLDFPVGRPVVLAPGQVEDDASIQLGAGATRTNLALLTEARRRNPDAFLIFKPHPDVAAGLRRGAVPPADAARLADRVVVDAPIAELLLRVDRVETMTSLAGFEALLRGVAVAAHGRPFYAGWGLTEDLAPHERRTRRLALDELVAGALILYPRYVDPATGRRCPPEVLVDRLAAARDAAQSASPAAAAARLAYARARHALLGPIGAALARARGVAKPSERGRDEAS